MWADTPILRAYGTSPAAHIGYWAALLVIMAMGYALYVATERAQESGDRVHHTLEGLQTIAQVRELFSRAEASQRGFILSGERYFLDEREEALASLGLAIESLRTITAGNREQQRRLEELRRLVAERVGIMQESVRVRETEGIEAAGRRTAGVGEAVSKKLFSVTDAMRAAKLEHLTERRAEERLFEGRALEIVVAAILIAATLILPGYVGFIRQARARYQAERRLFEMAESLPGAVFQYRKRRDGSGRYEFVTSNAERVRGIVREAALEDPKVVFDTILEEDKPDFFEARRVSEEALAPMEHDYRIRDGEGRMRWIHTSAAPSRQPDGSVLWSGHWADVTDKKSMEAALVEAKEAADLANRAKSVFLATMSHEIRTPMNGLLGMLELLALTKLDGDQRTTLGVIRRSAKSLLRIIDDILDFSKVEAGKLELRPEPAALDDVIENTVNLYAGNASSKGLSLRTRWDPSVSPNVVIDPVRLQQILNNFVSNAVKFTQRGHVEIRTDLVERRGDRQVVRFSVRDTGIGMSPDEQKRLFQPFTQLDRDTTRAAGGTGLGLSICRRLAELMGGSVAVESVPGRGTTMLATIPMEIADGAVPSRPSREHEPEPAAVGARRPAPGIDDAEREGSLVLVADDHPVNRLVMERQLAALGYAALIAKDGVEALALWRSRNFGVVITDCNMPRMDGFDLARQIRKEESSNGRSRKPILACTANAFGGDAERCIEAGMDDYLAKPVELGELAGKLDRWLPYPTMPTDRAPGADSHDGVPLDHAVLRGYSGGDRRLERELLAEFHASNELDMAEIENALVAPDPIRLTRAFHRVNGASRTIGANVLAAVAKELEGASRGEDFDSVRTQLPRFYRELERLRGYIAGL